jgi:AbrB family looped-hinge helix DNA binding protein
MPVAKVSSRGQVTLPSAVREELEIQKGDKLLIDVDPEKKTASFRVIKRRALSEFYRALLAKQEWIGKEAERSAVGRYLSTHAEKPVGKRRRR